MRAVHGEAHAAHAPSYLFSRGALGPAFESPARVEPLLAALDDLGVGLSGPVAHPDAALLGVHDEGLVAFVRDFWAEAQADGAPEGVVPDVFPHPLLVPAHGPFATSSVRARPGARCFDCSSPLLAGTWRAAREAVDIALTAADLLLAGEMAYALARPPGHHAGRDFYGGFCFFNNSAVAAAHLRDAGRRVAVIDLDIHHGNGTQAIFWDDPRVLTLSVHEHPDIGYPYFTGYEDETGGPGAPGLNVNSTVAAGCDDDSYLRALIPALARVAEFEPDAMVVPLGLDGLSGDPLSSARLTPRGFGRIGAEVAGLRLPTLVVQEGGYALEDLRAGLAAFLGAL
jgi:acetoin utilization deacetylase AcuC-like enzyme